MIKKVVNNCKACFDELAHKTSWPTRKELTNSAVLVLSASLIIALIVFVMDQCFGFIMGMVYPG
ncbi:MAG: preprotein translocase subunit SecE [Bacteroidaceae bacterium]|nr:preprotein translocase subunit SecE [Bacteroidaceae bacterium]